jgi:hypothetical protein
MQKRYENCGYNYKGVQAILYCQRQRGKTYLQIVLEALSKLLPKPDWSNKLMEMSLAQHGIGLDVRLEQVVDDPAMAARSLKHTMLLDGHFFLDLADENLWAAYESHFVDEFQAVVRDAERICRHEFDLLGSGPFCSGNPIDWHIDPVSGYRWSKKLFSELRTQRTVPNGGDLKLPWELSRMQHLATLGKAFRLTRKGSYASEIVDQINHWIDDNPCPYGVNWTCAMDVAIRAMNIIWGYLFIKDASPVTDEFRTRLAVSLWQHGQFILSNLEFGPRKDGSITNSNHYITDIVGLLCLGLMCPALKFAEQWKVIGIKALIEEMDRQVYQDGVNFESSVSYHRLVLELFTAAALLCRTNNVVLPNKFWTRLERMFEFVLYVTRPDGKIPVVGDADDGRLFILSNYGNWDRQDCRYLLSIGAMLFDRADMKANTRGFSEEAFWFLGHSRMSAFAALNPESADLQSKAFPDGGFYVMRQSNRYLVACCGEVGTNGVGNHKHNDLLSFELYAGDKPFIVDPGSYVYTRDAKCRNLFRSTKYHNTVVVDGQEQNRFEPGRMFEMTPDAKVLVHKWLSTVDIDLLDVEHTGYARLDPPVSHRRMFQFNKAEGIWNIVDVLSGAGEHSAEWYFHFDAGIVLAEAGEGIFRTCCEGTNLELALRSETPVAFKIEDGWVSRQYGKKLPAKVLRISGRFESVCRLGLTIRTLFRDQVGRHEAGAQEVFN